MNWVGVVLRIALFLTVIAFAAGACSLVVNTDPYTAGCGSTKKYCQLDTGEMACVDKTDPNFGCGREGCFPCAPDHVLTPGCDPAGVCAIAQCVSGYQDCDKNPDNGCETRTDSDTLHCGMCTTNCEDLWHRTAGALHVFSVKCVNSLCRPNACDPGWMDCDTALTNGCENDCGRCCPAGQMCNTTTMMCAVP